MLFKPERKCNNSDTLSIGRVHRVLILPELAGDICTGHAGQATPHYIIIHSKQNRTRSTWSGVAVELSALSKHLFMFAALLLIHLHLHI